MLKERKRHKPRSDRCIDTLPSEIDNYADTTCFGKNFRVISFTSEVCSVSPYLSEYDSITDIPICTAATAVDMDSGETIILEFGQGIWFGDRLNHSLINPNQCRSHGISVCDDPTDQTRDIGMELPKIIFYHSECVVPHATLSRDHLISRNSNRVGHFKCLMLTNGIQQTKCLFRMSDGDIIMCVRLTCLMCV